MNLLYFPDQRMKEAMQHDAPLMLLVSFDKKKLIVAPADDVVEHHILLKKSGEREQDIDHIDRYYRVVLIPSCNQS